MSIHNDIYTYHFYLERIGEPLEVPLEASTSIVGGTSEGIEADDWRNGLAPALLGGGLAAFLATLAGLMLLKRKHTPHCLRRNCSLQQVCQPHPQLYTTEPGKRNGKALSPPDGNLLFFRNVFEFHSYFVQSFDK